MSVYGKNHYNIVISLQLIKINGKKKFLAMIGLLVKGFSCSVASSSSAYSGATSLVRAAWQMFFMFPGGSNSKESACNAGEYGFDP